MFSGKFFLSLFLFSISASAMASAQNLLGTSTKDFLISKASTGCMPKGMKLDPVGNSLYVAEMCGRIDPRSNTRIPSVSIYDMNKRTLSKVVRTPLGILEGGIYANTEIEFSLDELWGFVTRSEGDSGSEIYQNTALLSVINPDTQKIAKYIPLKSSGAKIISARPYIAEDTRRSQIIYVANYFSDNISMVDVTDLREDGNLDGTKHFSGLISLKTNFKNPASRGYFIAPRGIAFTPDGRYALILATETGSIIVIDSVNHKQIAEIAPINNSTAGRELNVRHIIVSNDGATAYLSHMRGNAISRINMTKLIGAIKNLNQTGPSVTLPSSIWDELLMPFQTPEGPKKILILEDYPKDHPNFPGKKWSMAHPNTIVLEPMKNRYLFVSSRTTSDKDINKVDPKIMGKIDIIDTQKGVIVYSLVGGAQPTALEISRDGKVLISAGFINDMLYFFNLSKILTLYETGER